MDTVLNSIDAIVMQKIHAHPNPPGTVVFPKIGGAIATNKRRLVIRPTIVDNNCSGIQPIGLTNESWLMLLLQSLDFTKYQSGTSVPAVSQAALAPIRIGLPPLAEQKRIVAKVDELMALCDRLEAQQRERATRHAALARAALARFDADPTPANLDYLFHPSFAIDPADIRGSILALAVQGKLAVQNPNDEPAYRLAKRIRLQKLTLCPNGRHDIQVNSDSNASGPYVVPSSWVWIPLGHATCIRTGKLDANASTPDGQFPFFTCAKVPLRINSYAYDGECVLLAGNGNFDVNYYNGKFEAYQRTYIIEGVDREMVDGRYLFRYIQTYADTLREMSLGGVINYIKIGFLTDAPFPLPPLPEQRRIVAKVDELMARVDKLEANLTAARATAARLLDAAVAELTAPAARTHDGPDAHHAAAVAALRDAAAVAAP